MKELSIKEKIEIINKSENLESILVSALPQVFGSSYYFVSYSHKDYKKVYTDILRLQEKGINIWYDRGLQAGKSWEDYASEAISKYNCIGVIFYMSENSIVSDAVLHEIKYVRKIGKDFLSINLPIEQNQSNINKVLSIPKMLELTNIKNNIKEENSKYLKEIFHESVIYIDYNSPIEYKIDRIISLNKPPLFNFRKTNKNECELASINSIDMKNIEISESEVIDDTIHTITSIGNCAFANCKQLENIVIPENCLSIGEKSFFNCQSLKEIAFPSSLENINDGAFGNCINLNEICFPDKLTTIGEFAFEDCSSLTSIVLSNDLYEIKDGAFKGTSLKEISMKENPTLISPSVFVQEQCIINKNIDGKFKKKKSTIKALKEDKLYKYKIVGGVSVGDITFPSIACEINPFSYSNCRLLKSITIPSNITLIGHSSFKNCLNLEKVNFSNISSILSKKLKLSNQQLTISHHAFEDCKSLREIAFSKQLWFIGQSAFSNCTSLKTIKFENGCHINRIFNNAFEDCTSLEEIIIPCSVTQIGFRAFAGCTNLKRVIFENNSQIKTIEDFAFANCTSLQEIQLPNKLVTLNNFVFSDCTSLEKVYISKSVKNIKNAFAGCSNLKIVNFDSKTKLKNIFINAFNSNKNVIVNFPKSKKRWEKVFQTSFVATMGAYNQMYNQKQLKELDPIKTKIEDIININFKN